MEQKNGPTALPYPETAKPRPAVAPAPPRVAVSAAVCALGCSLMIYPSLAALARGDALFGVNLPICVALVYAAFASAMRGQRKVEWRRGWPMLAVIAPLAAAPALFSVPELIMLDLLALCVMIPLHLSLLSGGNWHRLSGVSLLEQAVIDLLGRPFAYIADGCRATLGGASGKGALRNLLLAFVGAAVAAPVLFVVVFLLAVADSGFESIMNGLFNDLDLPQIFVVLFVALLALFPLISFFYSLPLGKNVARPQAPAAPRKGIHPVPVLTALAMFDAVLLLFAAIRVGGFLTETLIEPSQYSARAHEGFFPMLAAAVICFGVQWVCLRFTRREGRALPLRVLVTAMSAGLIVMMASAMRSILIYQGAFGMTRLRVYVTVCIGALFALLALTLIKVWTKRFPYKQLVAAVLCGSLIGVNYCNVDRMIATNNMAMRIELGHNMDYHYLTELSVDALDVLVQYPFTTDALIEYRYGENAAERLMERFRQNQRALEDARVWNLGRARANAAYEALSAIMPISMTQTVD